MASLNDIETQLNTIITALGDYSGGVVELIPIEVNDGIVTLTDTTFDDIRERMNDKIIVLQLISNDLPQLFYPAYSVENGNYLVWIRTTIHGSTHNKVTTALAEDTSTTNVLTPYAI